jgi:hypothetical protein
LDGLSQPIAGCLYNDQRRGEAIGKIQLITPSRDEKKLAQSQLFL